MQYGICHLSLVPVRSIADDTGEMITQLLYGEHFKVLERRKIWSRIRIAFDQYEGWVNNQQFALISEDLYLKIDTNVEPMVSSDLISFIETEQNVLLPIVLGSSILQSSVLNHYFEGSFTSGRQEKRELIETALLYLNAPYLWGGKSVFGIDSSGFTQMVYKINGHQLLRDAKQQSTQGEALSFIEESEPGDLAFFDNNEGVIDHVGIIMDNNYIIHSYGKVRLDRLDHSGIFSTETNTYTHSLRVIKKII
ncbi:Gamma-D-glutamyl-L-lysine dipeptidyl-peptidase [Arenibacter antarcticus]|uniref:NlpC/P60 family protein n=1 Tax=Arenibacter antarcticus TaxID=2040469 RepID=A0ABW5VHX6_9FLAO|nr:C40 family peptidase [Arenibacter sp. H213]MCM4168913.1 hydrolase Nlp/P60 [Arenibacter sp. H213]